MTRRKKVAKARSLREEGLNYREIGERLGVHPTTVWGWLNAAANKARVRRSNAKRKSAKRAWEAGKCPKCGGPLSKKDQSRCEKCRRFEEGAATMERIECFITLRERGLLNYQIAEHEGCSTAAVATLLYLAKRKFGLPIPPSPYRRAAA